MEKEKNTLTVCTLEHTGPMLVPFVRHISADPKKRLADMYKILKCRLVDVMEIEADGHVYDLWFDEEYLMKNPLRLTLIVGEPVKNGFEPICGNVLVARANEDGETIGLEPDDLPRVKKFFDEGVTNLMKAHDKDLI